MKFILKITVSSYGTVYSDAAVLFHPTRQYCFIRRSGTILPTLSTGDPRENPQVERIHGTIKNEILQECKFHNIDEAEETVNRAVDYYNNEKTHMSVGMRTPAEASKSTGERKLKWRSYREQAIKRKLVMNHTENSLLVLYQ